MICSESVGFFGVHIALVHTPSHCFPYNLTPLGLCLIHAGCFLHCGTPSWRQQQQNESRVSWMECLIDMWEDERISQMLDTTHTKTVRFMKIEGKRGATSVLLNSAARTQQYKCTRAYTDKRSFQGYLFWLPGKLYTHFSERLQAWNGIKPRPLLPGDLALVVLFHSRRPAILFTSVQTKWAKG